MFFFKRALLISVLVVASQRGFAQTWNGLGTNDNWQTGANWIGSVAPINNGTANVIFAGATRLTPNVDVVYSVNSITFNNTSGAFSIGGSALGIGAGGVINNDTDMQTINSSINVNASEVWAANFGPLTFNSLMSINAANILTFSAGAGSSIISGGIAGTGSFTKTGGGTLTLSGGANNGFSGAFTVNAGTVIFNKTPGLRAFGGSLIIGDGSGVDTVQYAASNQSSLPSPVVNSSGVLDLNGFNDSYQNLTINGGSTTIDAGALIVSNALTMTGGSISSAGVGRLVTLGSITTSPAASSATISGNVDLQGNSHNFSIADGAAAVDLDISASISGGVVNKMGAGTLRLSGSVSNSISTQISTSAGTLELAKTGGAIAGSLFLGVGDFSGGVNADIVRFLGSQQLDPATSISVNPAGLLDLNGFDQNVAHVTLTGGNISTGTGSLALLDGPGIATTISSQTATLAGHLNLTNSTRTITVADGAAAVDFDISAAIETATPAIGGLTKNGTGTMRMSGAAANNYGITFVNQGTLLLGKTILNGAIPGDLSIGLGVGSGLVRLEQNDQIADSSIVTIRTGSVLDLNGHQETITALDFPNGGGSLSAGAGTLVLLGNVSSTPGFATNTISGNLNLAFNNHTFTIQDSGAVFPDLGVYANIFNGSLSKDGSGELGLYGNNNLQVAVLSDGTLLAGSNLAFGTGTIFLNGGTLAADNGDRTLSNPVILGGSATIGGQFNLTLTGTVTGSGNLTKSGSNVLGIAAGNFIAGAWTLASGTLLSSNLAVAAHGSLTMNNGTFSGVLNNSGTFTYNNGVFNGSLTNHGTVIINNTFLSVSAGITNFADLTLDNGLFLTTVGLTNNGQINLNGATLDLTNSSTNNGSITGFGTIGGPSQFFNNGLITQIGGNLILKNNGGQTNFGNIDLAPGRQLIIQNTSLDNLGTINLNGAVVPLGAPLFNLPTGTVAGRGSIQTFFDNNGLLLVQGGTTNVTSGFSNGGIIQVAGVGSSLIGGKIASSGTIQGSGAIGSDVNNSGTIEAIGGTLIFSGAVNNSGTIAASTTNKVLISSGLVSNTGIINLTGGTFDNNGLPLTNAGQISGYGTFRASQFTNNGSMTFSGGTSTINGSVTNSAGHQIRVAFNPAIFTGDVTNNGTFKNTSTTITFAGPYHEFGTFISDPADNFFSNVNIGPTGAWIGGHGDRFFLTGDLLNSSTNKTGWQTDNAELRFTGGSNHLLSILGDDLGIDYAGYENNFSWGTLTLGASDKLSLEGEGSALYVRELILPGGLAQIESILGSNHNIYYDLNNPANAYLHGQRYSLSGGGQIAPVPEPAGIVFELSALFMLIRRRRKNVN